MKKISVHKFRNNISEYLKGLPITITKHGKPVAIIQKPSRELQGVKEIDKELIGEGKVASAGRKFGKSVLARQKKVLKTLGWKIKPAKKILDVTPIIPANPCKHGAAIGLCKHGCKK